MANSAVGIIMGSRSDWGVMENAVQILDQLGVSYEAKVVSAHRTPDRLYDYARSARERGLKAIIAGAGGAAHNWVPWHIELHVISCQFMSCHVGTELNTSLYTGQLKQTFALLKVSR